jgi:hemoglobin
MSLHRRLGGDEGIAKLVEVLTQRLESDAELAPYFAGINLSQLNHHRTMFLSALTGGSGRYTGRSMPHAHVSLNLREPQFTAFLRLLETTLRDCAITGRDARRIMRLVGSLRGHVVTSG